jgi:hypothetical protein
MYQPLKIKLKRTMNYYSTQNKDMYITIYNNSRFGRF